MSALRLSLIAFTIFWATTSYAQDRGFGLGVILGEPSGVSGKSWLNKKNAFAGAVAWSLEREEALHVHLDHLFHDFDSLPVEQGTMAWYYGFGGRIKFAEKSTLSVRIPVGLNYLMGNAPVDFFFEIVPLLDLIPNTEFNLNGGLGIRYFFKTVK
jgi:hypothetical protein